MDLSEIKNLKNLDANNFFLLAGPCAIEGEEMALRIAEKVVTITSNLKFLMFLKDHLKRLTVAVLIALQG